jgi:hypothetical protein
MIPNMGFLSSLFQKIALKTPASTTKNLTNNRKTYIIYCLKFST